MKFTKRSALASEGTSAANYLKILDGQSVTGVPRGEVFEYWQKWPQGGMKEVFAVPTMGASSRFKINVVVQEDGKFVAKVFDFGPRVYNQLADIAEELDLTKTKIKISRRGSAKNTEWNIFPLGTVEGKALTAIEAVELNKLGASGSTPAPAADDGGELPF